MPNVNDPARKPDPVAELDQIIARLEAQLELYRAQARAEKLKRENPAMDQAGCQLSDLINSLPKEEHRQAAIELGEIISSARGDNITVEEAMRQSDDVRHRFGLTKREGMRIKMDIARILIRAEEARA
jgi:hypothetical protein